MQNEYITCKDGSILYGFIEHCHLECEEQILVEFVGGYEFCLCDVMSGVIATIDPIIFMQWRWLSKRSDV